MKTVEREGYLALQLGCGAKRDKQVDKQCAPAPSMPERACTGLARVASRPPRALRRCLLTACAPAL